MNKKNMVEGVTIGALLHSAYGKSMQMHTCIPNEGTLDRGRARRPISPQRRESVGTQELAKHLNENGGQTATFLAVLCAIKLAKCASTPWWDSTKWSTMVYSLQKRSPYAVLPCATEHGQDIHINLLR